MGKKLTVTPVSLFKKFLSLKFIVSIEKVSEYDQGIPQSRRSTHGTVRKGHSTFIVTLQL